MNQIKISIVMPNYNHAQYLPKSLESILAQTTQAHEVILVDDGSKDNSLEVMAEYAQKSPIIKIIAHEKNMGIEATVNESLNIITGTHILFMGADDWMLPNMLENAYSMLNAHPEVAFWCCGSWSIYEEDTDNIFPTPMNYPPTKHGLITPEMAKQTLYRQDSWFCGNTMIHNKKLFIKEKGLNSELKSFADNFLYRVLSCKYGCCFTPKRLSVWRIRRAGYSQTNSQQPESLMQITNKAISLIKDDYPNVFPEKLVQRMHRRLLFDIAKAQWIADKSKLSVKMREFLRDNKSNSTMYLLCRAFLELLNSLPLPSTRIGLIALYLSFKPFDLVNGVNLRTLQRLNRA